MDQERYSYYNIKKGLKILCNRQRNFSYDKYKIILQYLQTKEIKSVDDLTKFTLLKCRELGIDLDEDFIRSIFSRIFKKFYYSF